MDSPKYTIELRAPGEEAVYRHGEAEYHLYVTWEGNTPTVHQDSYWDGKPNPTSVPLSEELRETIVPRIYDFLNTWKEKTPVGVVFTKNPVTGAYERL